MFLLLLLPSLSIAQYDMNPGNFGVMTNFHVASSLPSKHQTASYPTNPADGREVGKTNPRTPDQRKPKTVGLPTISFRVNMLDFNLYLGLEANSSAGPESELAFQVVVLECKDLPDTDSSWLGFFSTSPDPHVRVALRNSGFKKSTSTSTMWQQNNPTFHQSVTYQGEAQWKSHTVSKQGGEGICEGGKSNPGCARLGLCLLSQDRQCTSEDSFHLFVLRKTNTKTKTWQMC